MEGITYANRLQRCQVLIEKNYLEFYQEKEASYFQVRIFIILQYSSNILDSLTSLPIQAHISFIIAKFCVCILVNLVFNHSLFLLLVILLFHAHVLSVPNWTMSGLRIDLWYHTGLLA